MMNKHKFYVNSKKNKNKFSMIDDILYILSHIQSIIRTYIV